MKGGVAGVGELLAEDGEQSGDGGGDGVGGRGFGRGLSRFHFWVDVVYFDGIEGGLVGYEST